MQQTGAHRRTRHPIVWDGVRRPPPLCNTCPGCGVTGGRGRQQVLLANGEGSLDKAADDPGNSSHWHSRRQTPESRPKLIERESESHEKSLCRTERCLTRGGGSLCKGGDDASWHWTVTLLFFWGGGGSRPWEADKALSQDGAREDCRNQGSELSNATIVPQSNVSRCHMY